ncbi:TonB-dependent receptor [Sphingomonas gilva]|uniref:TonB-dependent receptor n=1 Tax=Sphingomonas gilva TaxID=2305907 RepID=A0A396RZA3_9SPHN|nr:TonB-dependent receptor [Sphingomonas gilva]RHW19071.1 TonB-dependent receptor [Sphingomonas gilva]
MRTSLSFRRILATGSALAALCGGSAAFAQSTPEEIEEATAQDADAEGGIIVTGSRIRRDPNDSSLPLQIVTQEELQRNAISNPEQLLMFLSTNGTGPDNLASNSDVVTGAQRGTNGLSTANLRGQGSAATLVLLNGRRVAAHGLSGSAVDVNQIPFSAVERVEVLKDGASAIYGTDAVGGVINFITRTDFQGIGATGFTDITEQGDGNIYRLSGIAGYGDLDEDGFNIMGAVSKSWNQILRGSDRDFVNGNQPERGLSIDTRGPPIATAFDIGPNTFLTPQGTLLGGLTLTAPNGADATGGGINILDLPGGAGCESMDGGMAYDELLWQNPSAVYACAWDTGRAAVIQQPIETLTYYGRGVVRLGGGHEISAEITGSDATSAKSFSHNQYSANATNLPIAYPLNDLTRETYNQVFNTIRAAFPDPTEQAALDARYGLPIAFRFRCIACGPREYVTNTKTLRGALGIEGPLWSGWDYRAGASYARSESSSVLGTGYHYRGVLTAPTAERGRPDPRAPTAPGATIPGIVGLFNAGILNPFSVTQTPEAMAALDSVSAEGVTLYGGRYEVRQFDASVSGPLFGIWGGDVQLAAGVDYREETYEFNGSDAAAEGMPDIFNAAFDNINALTPKERTVKAAYAEVLIPLLPELEITGAVRVDDYTGFGTTTNPKVSFKFRPIDAVMFRGSYNTGFRVPTFNQIFNGRTISITNTGARIADPETCSEPTNPNPAEAGCELITPDTVTGGNPELGPETAEQFSLGVVFQPSNNFTASVDWWSINVDNTIQELTFRQLLENYNLFPERFIRNSAGELVEIDATWANAGARRTQGLEVSVRGGIDALGGRFSGGLDGTYLLKKREKLTQDAPFSDSLIGVFTFTGDLGLRWKHNAFVSYSNDDWSISLSQLFRNGYENYAISDVGRERPDYNERVDDYVTYNLSVGFNALDHLRLTFGVKNIFDTDPPFAITYDGLSGAGGSWEPRVADPRGRAFTFLADVKF